MGALASVRFRRIILNVMTSQPKAAVLATAATTEYATIPVYKLGMPTRDITTVIATEMQRKSSNGDQTIHCLAPNDTDIPVRMCRRTMAEMIRRVVCLKVNANQSLDAEPGSRATSSKSVGQDPFTYCTRT